MLHLHLAFFAHCFAALEKRTYELAGKVLAYSIVHRGPLPRFFSRVLYVAITEGYYEAIPAISDIHDMELRGHLSDVSV